MMYLSLAPFSEYQPTSQPQLALSCNIPPFLYRLCHFKPPAQHPHSHTTNPWEADTKSVCVCVCVSVLSCFMRISSIATVNALKRRGTAGRDQCLCSLRMRGEIKEKVGEWKQEGERERAREGENKRERERVPLRLKAGARSLWSSKTVTFAWTTVSSHGDPANMA